MHDHADRIVRIVEDRYVEGVESRLATTYGPLAPALEADLPAVEQAVRVLPYPLLVSRGQAHRYQEDGFIFADSTFFEVFSFPLVHGDPATALDAPFSAVLTESTARKYFGDQPALGRSLSVRGDDGVYEFTVTGVAFDAPRATHIQFDLVGSFASMRAIYSDWIDDTRNWEHPPLYTYVLLAVGWDADNLVAELPALALKHMGESRTATRSLHAERLTDIRLHSTREGDLTPGSDAAYVAIFSIIAGIILLLACINFTNLATARASERAREVGVRKTLGASRWRLASQFFSESLVLVAAAAVLSAVLVQVLTPTFTELSGKSIGDGGMSEWMVWLILVGIAVVVGLLSGGYPAFHLSRFLPALVLKGSISPHGSPSGALFRKALVVFQLAVSISLIIGTVVITSQLDYLRNGRLGFDKEHVVLVPLRDEENQLNYETLKEGWSRIPGVAGVTASSGMPGLGDGLHDFIVYTGANDSLELMTLTVDHDYAEVYGLEIVEGRDFSEEFSTDEVESFLINESAAGKLGWTDPVGGKLTLGVWFGSHILKTGQVVGVIKDFQYNSLRKAIEPMVLHIFPNSYYYDYASARVRPEDVPGTLKAMESVWNSFNPNRPFEYTFLDDQFDALYRSEARMSGLFGAFAFLAIFIACLGLFGLAAFSAERRTKEIGLRKVLGSTVAGIVMLLSNDLLKLFAAAFVLSAPLAVIASRMWLFEFAHRIEISWQIVALAGAAALLSAWMAVSYHTIRAAMADPVKSLRYE
jgi:putative ABC transport system permease protein